MFSNIPSKKARNFNIGQQLRSQKCLGNNREPPFIIPSPWKHRNGTRKSTKSFVEKITRRTCRSKNRWKVARARGGTFKFPNRGQHELERLRHSFGKFQWPSWVCRARRPTRCQQWPVYVCLSVRTRFNSTSVQPLAGVAGLSVSPVCGHVQISR